MKNPFKKKSLTDALVNVGVGGAANVAIDYVWSMAGLDETISANITAAEPETVKNLVKIIGGAVAGGMVSGRLGRAAADGVATVGASNFISGLINSSDTEDKDGGNKEGTNGVPWQVGKTGRRMGQRGFRRAIRGTGSVNFME